MSDDDREEGLSFLYKPVESLRGVGSRIGGILSSRYQVHLLRDLLYQLPRGFRHRPLVESFQACSEGDYVACVLLVESHIQRGKVRMARCRLRDNPSEAVDLVWFSLPLRWVISRFPKGEHAFCFWEACTIGEAWLGFFIPMWWGGRIERVSGMRWSRFGCRRHYCRHLGWVSWCRASCLVCRSDDALPQWVSAKRVSELGLMGFAESLRMVHEPRSLDVLSGDYWRLSAWRRLAYDEFLASQLSLRLSRYAMSRGGGVENRGTGALSRELSLPFGLTGAQQRCLAEIVEDMRSPHRMMRLLQGDVGSGKTVVSLLASLSVIEGGGQVALMVPTDIVARQHGEFFSRLLQPLGVRVEMVLGSQGASERRRARETLSSGVAGLAIGTHALYSEGVVFRDLRLVVIDEQHRFGVSQRMRLLEKGESPDLLLMTATPIPRSLSLSMFGDMEVSYLDEKPVGRRRIKTVAMSAKTRLDALVKRVSVAVEGGERVFWVCAAIDEDMGGELMTLERRWEYLASRLGRERMAMVHGRMGRVEREREMLRFSGGEAGLLLSTTVVEVGVDVPLASVMVIENAERFGLAQLHQLRGRVGRGDRESVCVLLWHGAGGVEGVSSGVSTASGSGESLSEGSQGEVGLSAVARERLRTLRSSDDGFYLAEKDLALRGGGELLGSQQSGFPQFRYALMPYHRDLLVAAHEDAREVMKSDPLLMSSRGLALRELLRFFDAEVLRLPMLSAG